jgi:hypothetical protein
MGPKVVNQRPEKFDMGSFLTEPPCRRVSFLKKPPRIQREIAYEISIAHQIIVVLRIFPICLMISVPSDDNMALIRATSMTRASVGAAYNAGSEVSRQSRSGKDWRRGRPRDRAFRRTMSTAIMPDRIGDPKRYW